MASALKAIREHCVLCVNGKVQKNNLEIIKTCEHEKCPLWPYRMGIRPTDGTPPIESLPDILRRGVLRWCSQ